MYFIIKLFKNPDQLCFTTPVGNYLALQLQKALIWLFSSPLLGLCAISCCVDSVSSARLTRIIEDQQQKKSALLQVFATVLLHGQFGKRDQVQHQLHKMERIYVENNKDLLFFLFFQIKFQDGPVWQLRSNNQILVCFHGAFVLSKEDAHLNKVMPSQHFVKVLCQLLKCLFLFLVKSPQEAEVNISSA